MIGVVLLVLAISSSVLGQSCNYQTDLKVGTELQVYSPGYPRNYAAGLNCKWTIRVPMGYAVTLKCDDINIPSSAGCVTDVLWFNEVKFCSRGSTSLTSKSNVMEIQLKTTTANGKFYCRATTKLQPCSCGRRKTVRNLSDSRFVN